MNKKQWYQLGGVLVVAVVLGVGSWFYFAKVQVPAFPIASGDTIYSWTFAGPYAGNATLTSQANADIAHLKSLLGKGTYPDRDLYIGIGNDYAELGNGRAAYDAYDQAIKADPVHGLAYVNLAHLMDTLKAYGTARDAYAKAIAVEPGQLEYHVERLDFLTRQYPNDNTLLLAAFTDASKVFGDNAATLAIEANWLAATNRIPGAITAWKTVRQLSPSDRWPSIDAEIARLTAKLKS